MTEMELRETVVEQAKSWVGKKEADNSHRVIIDEYNKIRPLPRGYRMTYADPWCAAFVSAVGFVVGLSSIIYPECGCGPMINLYKRYSHWVEDDNYKPLPGDVIFYDWEDTGIGDNLGDSDHVGIVAEVNGDVIRVIEGNISDACGYRVVSRGGRYIRGYGVPDYKSMDDLIHVIDIPDDPGDDLIPIVDYETGGLMLPTLAKGSKGATVKMMQAMLIARKYSCGWWGADGDFGASTHAAVGKFQKDNKLQVTGKCDMVTWKYLLGVD